MACKYVKNFEHPKSFGFTGSATRGPNMACGGMVGKAAGGKVTSADVKLVNQVLNQAARTGRMPGVK